MNAKKKVFLVALAVAIIATLSLGTLAWFNDSEDVDNKFYFATTEDDTPDEVFNVVLTEDDKPEGKEYKDIEPGDVLSKDPTITNAGYYDQYIRATVTITNAAMFKEHIMENDSTFRADVFQGFDSTKWVADDIVGKLENDTLTYIFYYNGILAGEQTTDATAIRSEKLFTAVIIPDESLTKEDVAKLNEASKANDSFEINIKAEAVQTENVVEVATKGTAAAAKEAFGKVVNP